MDSEETRPPRCFNCKMHIGIVDASSQIICGSPRITMTLHNGKQIDFCNNECIYRYTCVIQFLEKYPYGTDLNEIRYTLAKINLIKVR